MKFSIRGCKIDVLSSILLLKIGSENENTTGKSEADVENRGGAGNIVEADARDGRGKGKGGIPRKQDDTASGTDSKPDASRLKQTAGDYDAIAGTQPITAGGAGLAAYTFQKLELIEILHAKLLL